MAASMLTKLAGSLFCRPQHGASELHQHLRPVFCNTSSLCQKTVPACSRSLMTNTLAYKTTSCNGIASSFISSFTRSLLWGSAPVTMSVRTKVKYSLNKGKPKGVSAVKERFMRLDWGAWIRTRAGLLSSTTAETTWGCVPERENETSVNNRNLQCNFHGKFTVYKSSFTYEARSSDHSDTCSAPVLTSECYTQRTTGSEVPLNQDNRNPQSRDDQVQDKDLDRNLQCSSKRPTFQPLTKGQGIVSLSQGEQVKVEGTDCPADRHGVPDDRIESSGCTAPEEAVNAKNRRSRYVALKLSYIGWDYRHGFAVQYPLDDFQTVEGALFKALLKTRLVESMETCNYARCARTDKGVSGVGQVVTLYLKSKLTEGAGNKASGESTDVKELPYAFILNSVLPPSIRILAWAPVDPDFKPRRRCTQKTYKYVFPKGTLDIKLMQEALSKVLIGVPDFRNICKKDIRSGVRCFRKKIISAEITKKNNGEDGLAMYEMKIVGISFLMHQIRFLMSVLFLVGLGLEKPDIIDELLNVDKNPLKPSYEMASGLPLLLSNCEFEKDDIQWIYDPKSHHKNITQLQALLEQHLVKVNLLKSILDDLKAVQIKEDDNKLSRNAKTAWLVPQNCISANYKPLMERSMDMSVEEKLERHEAKRNKKKVITEEANET